MAKTQRIKRVKDNENGTVTFTVLESGQELVASVSEFSPEIVQALAVHGMNAKIGDAAASKEVDAFEAMNGVVAQLKSGEFNARSGGEGGTKTTQLAQALAVVTETSMEDVQAKLAEMSDEQKKELKAHPQIKAAVEKIKADKAKEAAKKAAAAAKDSADDTPLNF